jgi:methylglutaconyl-CoA hydratase
MCCPLNSFLHVSAACPCLLLRTIYPAASLKLLMLLQVQVEPLSTPNEGISVVSLTRSSAKNAIGRQLLRELQEAINTLRQERTTRVVVLRSSCPGTFSAGADLKVRQHQAACIGAEA